MMCYRTSLSVLSQPFSVMPAHFCLSENTKKINYYHNRVILLVSVLPTLTIFKNIVLEKINKQSVYFAATVGDRTFNVEDVLLYMHSSSITSFCKSHFIYCIYCHLLLGMWW